MYFVFCIEIHSYTYRGFYMLGITYITMSKFWSLANASLLLLQKLLQFRKKVFAGKRRKNKCALGKYGREKKAKHYQ